VIERRQHPPECLRQEEWGEIKEFVKNTGSYREGLKGTLEDIRKENKARPAAARKKPGQLLRSG
jgi:hypothetical protein